MNKIERAITAYRWVCGDEGTSPGPDICVDFAALDDGTAASEQMIARLLPIVAHVYTCRDVRAFIARAIVHDNVGWLFDPSLSFADYSNDIIVNNKLVPVEIYNNEQADDMDTLLSQAIGVMDEGKIGIYEFAMELLHALYFPEL